MTGLLIKDWKLLMNQRRSMLMVLAFTGIVMLAGSDSYASFFTSYLTFMASIYTFSSFSYDEYENGMDFLIALPSGRKDYVKEKYLFCFLIVTGGWLMGFLLRIGLFLMRYSWEEYLDVLPAEPVYLFLVLIFVNCAIPFILKYGVEKGRMMVLTGLAVVCFAVYLAARAGMIEDLEDIADFQNWSLLMLFAALTAATAIVIGISYLFSLRIMRKKEF